MFVSENFSVLKEATEQKTNRKSKNMQGTLKKSILDFVTSKTSYYGNT